MTGQLEGHDIQARHFDKDCPDRIVSSVLGSWLVKAAMDATKTKLTDMFDGTIVAAIHNKTIKPIAEKSKEVRIPDAEDKTTFLMLELGFNAGMHVKRRKSYDDMMFTITSFANGEASELYICCHQAMAPVAMGVHWTPLQGKLRQGVSIY